MSKLVTKIETPTGGALPIDANPNVTAPASDRVMRLPRQPTGGDSLWMAAEGGAPSVVIWMLVGSAWIPLSSAFGGGPGTFTLSSGAVDRFAQGSIPFNCDLFVQVTVPNGATRISIGYVNT